MNAVFGGEGFSQATLEGDGRVNFVVARCTIDTLEWLRLDGDVWRRLRFTWQSGTPQWQWLAP